MGAQSECLKHEDDIWSFLSASCSAGEKGARVCLAAEQWMSSLLQMSSWWLGKGCHSFWALTDLSEKGQNLDLEETEENGPINDRTANEGSTPDKVGW